MKNTALIKGNVLLLAQGQGGPWLCWGWMHLATTAAWGWGSLGWQQALLRPEPREHGLQRGSWGGPRGHRSQGGRRSPGYEPHGMGS